MPVFSGKIHTHIYILSLSLCAFALPLSVFIISVCLGILTINWLLEEPLTKRWQKIKSLKPLWFIAIFYIVHLLGLINTSDFGFATHDLHIKLPFLLLPVIIGTSEIFTIKWLRIIILSFIGGVFISSVYSFIKILTASGDIMSQMPVISPFVWHIRLSLMSVFAVFIIPWLIQYEQNKALKAFLILLNIWFIVFLFIFQSLTGIIIFIILALYFIFRAIYKMHINWAKWFLTFILLLIMAIGCYLTISFYNKNFTPYPIDINNLEKYTVNGYAYFHHPVHTNMENGHYVDIYICNKELETEWQKRSKIHIDSTDIFNNNIRQTLIRYLTGKGLRKDSAGISKLTPDDIWNIENGVSNELFTKKAGLKPRMYRTMWELYHYSQGANPSGYSVAMRIEYYKTMFRIIGRHFWFGTGTGDVLQEFQNQYNTDHSKLEQKWRLRGHNQFLTFMLTFGIFGFLAISAAIFIPPALLQKYNSYPFGVFFTIIILSMFGDDTLETHAAITLFALFYSLFLFSNTSATKISEEKNHG